MAKLVRRLTSNEEILSSNLSEGILFFLYLDFRLILFGDILLIINRILLLDERWQNMR